MVIIFPQIALLWACILAQNLIEIIRMGSIYANIVLKGPKAKDILQELGDQGHSAFISPTQDELTTIYDLESDDKGSTALVDLAAALSGYFGCPALAVHAPHEELFCYWFFVDGELMDKYQSPAPFMNTVKSIGGNPEFLIQHFNTDVSSEEISEILHCSGHDCGFTLAADRHLGLAELLGLPLCSVGYGFCDLDSGEYPEDLNEDDLLRVDED